MHENTPDEIQLTGLVFFGRHGVNPEETELGQRFGVDVTLRLDLSPSARTDNLDDTVSYSAIYKLVRAEVEGEPSKLLEHLAGRLLTAVLGHSSRIGSARVKVTKLHPPLKGLAAGEVAAVMERGRAWLEK
jgi:7,8-dihydroneopterin aldolase/epimerase/oxygenase